MRSIKSVIKSFGHAWDGLLYAFREEQSFRIQLVIALIIGILTLLLPLERWERALVILAIGAVLVLELLNSIIERFVDMVKPRIYEYARHIKDLSAAAVLVMAFVSIILAIIIFVPHLQLLTRI